MIAMSKVFAKIWKRLKEVLRISWLNLQTNLHITKKKKRFMIVFQKIKKIVKV